MPPVTAKGQVKIVLNQAYLNEGLVDSAFLIWAVQGGFDSLAFHVEDSNLVLSPKALPEQEADYRISVMTSIKLSGASLKWDRWFKARIDSASFLSFEAPKNIGDGDWLPRVILNDHSGLIAFSGIRPSDPHFTLFRIDRSWQAVEFDRSY